MPCAESPRVHAYFDGELDPVAATDVEQHAERCVECRTLLEEIGQLRSALREQSAFEHAPADLHSRVMRMLDGESEDVASSPEPYRRARGNWNARLFWTGAFGAIGGAAVAAGLALLVIAPRFNDPLLDDLVNAHVRSLMPAHLIDVVSTDKHTVKPWFAGHTDVSPVVADFEPQGYRLMGGRADYFSHQRAAVVVYQHGAHTINVFSWSAASAALPKDTTRSGYHLAFWKSGDLDYCAVSDAGWNELLGLVRLLQDTSIGDARE